MNDVFDKFEKQLLKLNMKLTKQKKEQFSKYYELLIEWNQRINLTAITELDEVIDKHFLDSIALGNYLQMEKRWSVIDLGTGAGFPGIPLKIMFPQLEVLLADSLNKEYVLEEVIVQLQLENICAVHGRAEELAHQSKYRERYDLCVSRAVAHLSVLSEYCLPFVKTEGGVFVAYKSAGLKEELMQAKKAIQIIGENCRQ